jgi:hypothetical protein
MSANTFNSMELIVGDADQLNPANIRYTVRINRGGTISNWLSAELYRVDAGARIRVEHNNPTSNAISVTVNNISRVGQPDQIFLGLSFSAAAVEAPET